MHSLLIRPTLYALFMLVNKSTQSHSSRVLHSLIKKTLHEPNSMKRFSRFFQLLVEQISQKPTAQHYDASHNHIQTQPQTTSQCLARDIHSCQCLHSSPAALTLPSILTYLHHTVCWENSSERREDVDKRVLET